LRAATRVEREFAIRAHATIYSFVDRPIGDGMTKANVHRKLFKWLTMGIINANENDCQSGMLGASIGKLE
jgi:hypothetical protein